ncbi:MAG: TRAP transporter small permease [Burkholderiales bacterium]|nr:TRAP transporter small permease [Burkholderiales bacterium]
MTKSINVVCRFLEGLIALALAIMVVLVFGNVVLRYGFNSGITVSEELSRWLFIWLTFLGATVCLKDNAHLGTDILISRLPPLGRKTCLVVGHLLMLWILWLLLTGAWEQTKLNLDVHAPVTGLSVGFFYSSGIVFAILSSALLLFNLWNLFTGQLKDDQLVMVQESEEHAELASLRTELTRTGNAAANDGDRTQP